jgi:FAD:protein FMN transferase
VRAAAVALSFACALGLLTGCRTAPESRLERHEFSRPAMGTLFRVAVYAPDAATASNAVTRAFARVAELERVCSDYDAASEISRVTRDLRADEWVAISPDLTRLLAESLRIARATDGAFDPTLGRLTRLWRISRKRGELPSPAALAEARADSGWQHVELDERGRRLRTARAGLRFDFGGIAKGFAVDEMRRILAEEGLPRHLVTGGGEIGAGEAPPGAEGWTVGLADPFHPGPLPLRVLTLRQAALSMSGDREQTVEINGVGYSHVIDPATGLGLTNRLAVAVLARRNTDSDPWSTALRVRPEQTPREVSVCRMRPGSGGQTLVFPGENFGKRMR